MIGRLVLHLLALGAIGPVALAQGALPVAPGGDPSMACGQKPEGRAYWTEYAFCDVAVRGPGKAKGLIFWSHGVWRDQVQYATPVPRFVRLLAADGWDVVRINRNNLHEKCDKPLGTMMRCWSISGVRHTEDLVQRARQARAGGYGRIVAAGQSFGGAISLEANAKTPEPFYAVIATAPGHASDIGDGSASSGIYYTLDKQLLDVLAAQRGARVVLVLPPNDTLVPHRYRDPMGPKARKALTAAGLPFVELDESLPINGHGAVRTTQFAAWFGACIRDFMDPSRSVPAGETACPSPTVAPAFLLPTDLKVPTPGKTGPARLLGRWQGVLEDRREVAVIVQDTTSPYVRFVYATGSGPNRALDMAMDTVSGTLEGEHVVRGREAAASYELRLDPSGDRLTVMRQDGGAKSTAVLTR